MATLADKDKIKEILRTSPDGMTLGDVSSRLGKTSGITSTLLTRLKNDKQVDNPESGIWMLTEGGKSETSQITETPKPQEEAGSTMKPGADIEEPVDVSVPGAYEKFVQICRSVGIKEDFLKSMTDHVFLGDVYNLNYVWETLNGMYLRPDVTKRIFNFWSRIIDKPIPSEITAQIMPSTTQAAKEAEVKAPTRFTLIGDELVPDPEGEFTFSQARQVMMARAVQGAAPQLGGEKVSDIIAAISPFMMQQQSARAEEIEKQGETSVLAVAIKALVESKNGGAQQPLSLNDVLGVVDKIEEVRRNTAAAYTQRDVKQPNALDELERMANIFGAMKNMFGSSNQGTSPVNIAIKGANGETGAIPLETFFQIDDHKRKVVQEEEDLANKRETGKAIRGFLDKIARAATNI